jgi:hypothetical protein
LVYTLAVPLSTLKGVVRILNMVVFPLHLELNQIVLWIYFKETASNSFDVLYDLDMFWTEILIF